MPLITERVPTLKDNYTYILICSETKEAAIVDAPQYEPVVARVEALGVTITKILSTHHHPDHSAANPQLKELYQVPVYAHPSDAERLPGFTHGLDEGAAVRVGKQEASVWYIPAHTTGHIAYLFTNPNAIFCGDTLFTAGCGRLFEGTPEDMFRAMQRFRDLPEDTLVYCGHEYTESNLRFAQAAETDNKDMEEWAKEVRATRQNALPNWLDASPEEMTIPSTIGREKRCNPFMRASSGEELGRLRSWKDGF